MVKLLHIRAGARLALQRHLAGKMFAAKLETWVLHSGRAEVIWEDADGNFVVAELELGRDCSAHAGQRHRLVGITDCDVFEASTPEADGTTERIEDDYRRPDETAGVRNHPNRGWTPDSVGSQRK